MKNTKYIPKHNTDKIIHQLFSLGVNPLQIHNFFKDHNRDIDISFIIDVIKDIKN